MKSLHDSLIVALDEEEKLEASMPAGCHAISGPGGYIVMPDELTVEEWETRQNKRPYEKPECNSRMGKGEETPHRCNAAQIRDITAPTPTSADEAADEKAFNELFPELETD